MFGDLCRVVRFLLHGSRVCIMDVDNVFDKIGDFGFAQKKIFYLVNILVHPLAGFQTLLIFFIGLDPDWSCTDSTVSSGSAKPRLLFGSIDPKACELFEKGQCKPIFEDDFTSIVTSVSRERFLFRLKGYFCLLSYKL